MFLDARRGAASRTARDGRWSVVSAASLKFARPSSPASPAASSGAKSPRSQKTKFGAPGSSADGKGASRHCTRAGQPSSGNAAVLWPVRCFACSAARARAASATMEILRIMLCLRALRARRWTLFLHRAGIPLPLSFDRAPVSLPPKGVVAFHQTAV